VGEAPELAPEWMPDLPTLRWLAFNVQAERMMLEREARFAPTKPPPGVGYELAFMQGLVLRLLRTAEEISSGTWKSRVLELEEEKDDSVPGSPDGRAILAG
jgi:hypothetical protein